MIEAPSACLSAWREMTVFDAAVLVDNFEGNSAVARRYLLSYIEDSRPEFDAFLKCLHSRDIDQIQYKAHLLMSSAKLIGAFKLAGCLEFLAELPPERVFLELDQLDFMITLSGTLTEICQFLNS